MTTTKTNTEENLEKEVDYQIKVTKAKLESFGIVTEDLEMK